ncbi:Alpha-amylase domain [Mactra antiquata]
MPGKSDVYLVSSKPTDGSQGTPGYDNIGYKPSDDDQVTFSAANGGEIPESKPRATAPYRGMGKDDLLHFSSQPFWRRLRMIFVSIIILGWLALIITVVALVLVYPKCRDPDSREWWQTESVYRIYIPSFKDSDDDGIGDLKGVEMKLDYVKNLGFSILSLSPFYKVDEMPDVNDFGKGDDLAITNHTDVLIRYGTLEDFDHLVNAAHDKGMYVVVDFIPTQTSINHPWFDQSSRNKTNEKKNFYVWEDSKPNNWKSKYGGSAWNSSSVRGQVYLYQTLPETPSLNLRSAMVLDELEGILDFWLDRGVDGFNIRQTAYLFVDYDLRDEPAGNTHIYTKNQPELYGVLDRWRSFVQDYNKTEKVRVLMSGVDGLDVRDVYRKCSRSGIQLPLNLFDQSQPCDGTCMNKYIDDWMNQTPSGKWPTWMTGDENVNRIGSRFVNSSFAQAFTVLTQLLPGTPVLFNGDELNMINTGTAGNDGSRDQTMRAIMAWNATEGKFCNKTCTPWTNEGEVASKEPTFRNLLRELADLRTNISFRVGEYHSAVRDESVVSFVREFDGETGYLVAVNFGTSSVTRDFTGSHDTIPSEAVVALSHMSSQEVEDDADPSSLEIGPMGAVVVSWDYVAKEL